MTEAWATSAPTALHRAAYADAVREAFWLEHLPSREPHAPLVGQVDGGLCVVGGGFTGLWAAIHAKTDDPGRDVVVLESGTVGSGASGRNAGFCIGSLTHGLENGLARFEDEMPLLERLSRTNLRGLVADVDRLGIDCDLEMTGEMTPSLAPHQDAWLHEGRELYERWGYEVELFPDAYAMQAEVGSPLYRSGLWIKDAGGVVDPAKLAVGLLDAATRLGVRFHEQTEATALEDVPGGVLVRAAGGAAVRVGGPCSPRARSLPCCGPSAATSSRSTTTRSCPSRSRPSSARASAGSDGRGSATPATAFTTTA